MSFISYEGKYCGILKKCTFQAYVDTVWGSEGGFVGQGQRLMGGSGGPSPPPDAGEIFLKKPMQTYSFRPIFQNFNENFAVFTKIFKKFLEFFAKIWRKN